MFGAGRITKQIIKDIRAIGILQTSHFKSLGFEMCEDSLKTKFFNIFKNDSKEFSWENEYLRIEYNNGHECSTTVYSKIDGRLLYENIYNHMSIQTLLDLIKEHKREYKIEQLIKENPSS